MNNLVYYITGPDGSGKTTYIKEIEDYYIKKNQKIKHIWIRSPKIFSKPLMAYCRLKGLTRYKIIDGVKYGKHEFYKSKFVSWLFPLLQLIDFKIKWSFTKINKQDTILFDRFALDTLADLMVDTNRFDLHKTNIGKYFIKLIPKTTQVLLLNVSEENIRRRKKDTLYDEHLQNKIQVYKILCNDLDIKLIDNNRDCNLVKKDIFNYLFDAGN